MTPPLVLPRATATGGFRHPGCSVLVVLGLNAILGVPAYFCLFFISYAFADPIAWTRHLVFLGLIASYAFITGTLATPVSAVRYPESSFHILNFGILTSLAINATAVGIGSIVSAANKDQGSVSTYFSTTTDIIVATSLFAFATACSLAAVRTRRVV